MTLRIIFFLVFIFSFNLVSAQSVYDTSAFVKVQKPPKFKHKKYKTFREFVVNNIEVTEEIKESIKGEQKFYFTYVVDLTGKVTKVELVRGENNELSKLIINTIESSPPWKPATIKRKPVNTTWTIAIAFNIE